MDKSPNKNNRLYFISKSLDEKIVEKIDNGNIKASDYMKVTSGILIDKYEWDNATLIIQEEITKEVLAEENMFGVRFNIQDIELNIDDIHQGGG